MLVLQHAAHFKTQTTHRANRIKGHTVNFLGKCNLLTGIILSFYCCKQEWRTSPMFGSLYVSHVTWPPVLAVLSEAGPCVNYGRPSQTTGRNQHEALMVTTTQSGRVQRLSVSPSYLSVDRMFWGRGCVLMRTQQLSSLDWSHWERWRLQATNVFFSRQRSFWTETFTEKCHRYLTNIMDTKQLCSRWVRNHVLLGNKSCLQNWIFTVFQQKPEIQIATFKSICCNVSNIGKVYTTLFKPFFFIILFNFSW